MLLTSLMMPKVRLWQLFLGPWKKRELRGVVLKYQMHSSYEGSCYKRKQRTKVVEYGCLYYYDLQDKDGLGRSGIQYYYARFEKRIIVWFLTIMNY